MPQSTLNFIINALLNNKTKTKSFNPFMGSITSVIPVAKDFVIVKQLSVETNYYPTVTGSSADIEGAPAEPVAEDFVIVKQLPVETNYYPTVTGSSADIERAPAEPVAEDFVIVKQLPVETNYYPTVTGSSADIEGAPAEPVVEDFVIVKQLPVETNNYPTFTGSSADIEGAPAEINNKKTSFFQSLGDKFNQAVAVPVCRYLKQAVDTVPVRVRRICDNFGMVLFSEKIEAMMPQYPIGFVIIVLLAFLDIISQGHAHSRVMMSVAFNSVVVYLLASLAEACFDRNSVYAIIARFGRVCSLCITVPSLVASFY